MCVLCRTVSGVWRDVETHTWISLVSFGREGETLSSGCSVYLPVTARFQPEIEWYRDGKTGSQL